MRGLLSAVVAVAGCAGLAATMGYALRVQPARAHALSPGDGRITALLSRDRMSADATAADRQEAVRLARRALREDPTAVPAVATLGLDAQLRGDMRAARRLFAYAQFLSRRDFPTQLWAIEDAVGRGDVVRALRHYDIALRTTRSAPEVLFPVLALANADPAVRMPLARTLAGRPAWSDGFVGYLIGSGADWRSTADLFLDMRRLGTRVPGDAEAAAVNGLLARGFPEDAWRYYATIRPGSDRRTSRDPRFVATLAVPSLLDWVALNDGGVTTSIVEGGVEFSVPSGIGGPLLRQMQMLPAGEYLLNGHGSGIEQPESEEPYWQLSCTDGRELGRVSVPASARTGGLFAGRFAVPPGCPIQILTLVARASNAVAGTTGRIDRALLRPVR